MTRALLLVPPGPGTTRTCARHVHLSVTLPAVPRTRARPHPTPAFRPAPLVRKKPWARLVPMTLALLLVPLGPGTTRTCAQHVPLSLTPPPSRVRALRTNRLLRATTVSGRTVTHARHVHLSLTLPAVPRTRARPHPTPAFRLAPRVRRKPWARLVPMTRALLFVPPGPGTTRTCAQHVPLSITPPPSRVRALRTNRLLRATTVSG